MQRWFAFACAGLGLAILGCGKSGIERTVITGSVTYQGAPVQQGRILFVPEGELPSSQARIANGAYRVESKGGIPVGTHKVKIRAYRFADVSSDDLAFGGPGKQFLPARYNDQTELRVAIDSTSQAMTHDFNLK